MTFSVCAACREPIQDQWIYEVLDRLWHANCIRCIDCSQPLTEKCYTRDGKLYCQKDFYRRYWYRRCSGCLQEIGQGEYYLRAWDQLYHYDCYKCCVCSRKMNTGEEIHLTQDNRFMCKEDFLVHNKNLCKNLSDDFDDDDASKSSSILNGKLTSPNRHIRSRQQNRLSTTNNEIKNESDLSTATTNTSSSIHDFDKENSSLQQQIQLHPSTSTLLTSTPDSNLSSSDCLKEDDMLMNEGDIQMSDCSLDCKDDDQICMTNTNNSSSGCSSSHSQHQKKNSSTNLDSTDNSTLNGNAPKKRGPRTTIKTKQLEQLKSAFATTPKPTRHTREELARETGLAMRVIQVWFQNRRSKERRIKQSITCGGPRRHYYRRVAAGRPFDESEMMPHPGLNYLPEGFQGDFMYQGPNAQPYSDYMMQQELHQRLGYGPPPQGPPPPPPGDLSFAMHHDLTGGPPGPPATVPESTGVDSDDLQQRFHSSGSTTPPPPSQLVVGGDMSTGGRGRGGAVTSGSRTASSSSEASSRSSSVTRPTASSVTTPDADRLMKQLATATSLAGNTRSLNKYKPNIVNAKKEKDKITSSVDTPSTTSNTEASATNKRDKFNGNKSQSARGGSAGHRGAHSRGNYVQLESIFQHATPVSASNLTSHSTSRFASTKREASSPNVKSFKKPSGMKTTVIGDVDGLKYEIDEEYQPRQIPIAERKSIFDVKPEPGATEKMPKPVSMKTENMNSFIELFSQQNLASAKKSVVKDEPIEPTDIPKPQEPINDPSKLILMQFPDVLPCTRPSTSSSTSQPELASLSDLPDGFLGKLQIYKSGKCRLKLNEDTYLDVDIGQPTSFLQNVMVTEMASPNTNDEHTSNYDMNKLICLGDIKHKLVVSLDVNHVLQNPEQ